MTLLDTAPQPNAPLATAANDHALPHPQVADAAIVRAAVERVGRRIAPLWPLQHFVAVNPFLGLSDRSFAAAADTMARVAGARMTMPRAFYADAIATGRIGDDDLHDALAEAPPSPSLPRSVAALKALALSPEAPRPPVLPTVADVAADLTGRDWPRLAVDRISAWAAGWFDRGQASWRSPWCDLGPYQAWRKEAMVDRTPEVLGLAGFRRTVIALPDTADALCADALATLGIPATLREAYLHRILMQVGGWAAYARYKVWDSELHGRPDATLAEFLAIRLAWDLVLFRLHADRGLAFAWPAALDRIRRNDDTAARTGLLTDLVLQSAYEKAWQRNLVTKLAAPKPMPKPGSAAKPARKAVQAAFCIDVRSEIYRRALESVAPEVETIGFAGFFGFPIEHVPLGHSHGGAQCPVLLTPRFTVCEEVKGVDAETETEILGWRLMRRRARKAWSSFKLAAVSSFGFVETLGLGFLPKLATDSLGLTRPVTHPSADGLDRQVLPKLGPRLAAREVAGRATGFDPASRLAMAEAVLKAMSMTGDFARLVLLAGHGSTTVNNPHATGLDCGACGGHTGEANARVAAAILNDPTVRAGLVAKGLPIPPDTVFIGALHDTTTDELSLFDTDAMPASHAQDLADLRRWLAQAGGLARAERAHALHLAAGRPVDAAIVARSRDWSQVRPEWGLAGCAAFIAAPRAHTAGLDLGGRSFLHSYDWRRDDGFGVLELIMTAPMVVASWIALQYYGSTVDNRAFGSGNKVLHNVVGHLGVLEGQGGDLRVGLPWQSVHDGETLVHEPMRLSVMIAAPIAAMNAVIAKHPGVADLLDNGWLHLFALDDGGAVAARYRGKLDWRPVTTGRIDAAQAA